MKRPASLMIATTALVTMLSACATTQKTEPPKEAPPEVSVRVPDGSKVTMSYEEFASVKALADRYVALQRRLKGNQADIAKIEKTGDKTYRITIILDDRTKMVLSFDAE